MSHVRRLATPQVFTTCRAIEAAEHERMAAAASGANRAGADEAGAGAKRAQSQDGIIKPRTLRRLVWAFPIVSLLCVGAVMVFSQYAGDTVLYPFPNNDPCAPCRCSGDGRLQMCPDFLDEVASILDLSNCGMTAIESGAFSGLDGLEELYLSFNAIATIESGAFSGLGSLYSLSLDSNAITTIESGAFSGLDGLERLRLSNNNITTIENNTFSGLGSLATIERDAFFGLVSLWRLYFGWIADRGVLSCWDIISVVPEEADCRNPSAYYWHLTILLSPPSRSRLINVSTLTLP